MQLGYVYVCDPSRFLCIKPTKLATEDISFHSAYLFPAVKEEFGELLHSLLWCGGTWDNLPREEVWSPTALHWPLLIRQVDQVGCWLLPFVPFPAPAVLHQQLSCI